MAGYGYRAGGNTNGANFTSVPYVEEYDDVADTWTAVTNLGTSRYHAACFTIDGYGFAVTGASDLVVKTKNEMYDNVAKTWTYKTECSVGRSGPGGFELNGFGYITAGIFAAVATERYDKTGDSWLAKQSLNGRWDHASMSAGGYGYVASGGNTLNSSMEYDDVAETWTTLSNVARSIDDTCGFGLNDVPYKAGGYYYATYAEKYTRSTNTWSLIAYLNTSRYNPTGFELNSYGYSSGGYGGTGSSPTSTTEKYDDVANTWTVKTSFNTATAHAGGFSISEAAAATTTKSGRPLRHSTGASVPGGIGCGMGKSRR